MSWSQHLSHRLSGSETEIARSEADWRCSETCASSCLTLYWQESERFLNSWPWLANQNCWRTQSDLARLQRFQAPSYYMRYRYHRWLVRHLPLIHGTSLVLDEHYRRVWELVCLSSYRSLDWRLNYDSTRSPCSQLALFHHSIDRQLHQLRYESQEVPT